MKRCIFTLALMAFSLVSLSQSGTIKVYNGKVIEGDFFKEKLYIFDKYVNGRIKLKDGTLYYGDLNINTLGQSLRVISDTGDTISIKTERDVDAVSAGNNFFVKLNNVYIHILNTAGDVFLGMERSLKIGQEKIEGAYGGSNEVSSISKLSTVEVENRIEKIVGSSTLKYDYYERLYFVKNGKILPISKKNFEKFFPEQKNMIEKYVAENNIKFNHNESVIELFDYLAKNR